MIQYANLFSELFININPISVFQANNSQRENKKLRRDLIKLRIYF